MTAVDQWFVHEVEVETYDVAGSWGPTYLEAQTKACWVEEALQLVRNTDGEEVTSSARISAPLEDRGTYTVGSRITLPGGRPVTVINLAVFDSGLLGLGLDHIEVSTT